MENKIQELTPEELAEFDNDDGGFFENPYVTSEPVQKDVAPLKTKNKDDVVADENEDDKRSYLADIGKQIVQDFSYGLDAPVVAALQTAFGDEGYYENLKKYKADQELADQNAGILGDIFGFTAGMMNPIGNPFSKAKTVANLVQKAGGMKKLQNALKGLGIAAGKAAGAGGAISGLTSEGDITTTEGKAQLLDDIAEGAIAGAGTRAVLGAAGYAANKAKNSSFGKTLKMAKDLGSGKVGSELAPQISRATSNRPDLKGFLLSDPESRQIVDKVIKEELKGQKTNLTKVMDTINDEYGKVLKHKFDAGKMTDDFILGGLKVNQKDLNKLEQIKETLVDKVASLTRNIQAGKAMGLDEEDITKMIKERQKTMLQIQSTLNSAAKPFDKDFSSILKELYKISPANQVKAMTKLKKEIPDLARLKDMSPSHPNYYDLIHTSGNEANFAHDVLKRGRGSEISAESIKNLQKSLRDGAEDAFANSSTAERNVYNNLIKELTDKIESAPGYKPVNEAFKDIRLPFEVYKNPTMPIDKLPKLSESGNLKEVNQELSDIIDNIYTTQNKKGNRFDRMAALGFGEEFEKRIQKLRENPNPQIVNAVEGFKPEKFKKSTTEIADLIDLQNKIDKSGLELNTGFGAALAKTLSGADNIKAMPYGFANQYGAKAGAGGAAARVASIGNMPFKTVAGIGNFLAKIPNQNVQKYAKYLQDAVDNKSDRAIKSAVFMMMQDPEAREAAAEATKFIPGAASEIFE